MFTARYGLGLYMKFVFSVCCIGLINSQNTLATSPYLPINPIYILITFFQNYFYWHTSIYCWVFQTIYAFLVFSPTQYFSVIILEKKLSVFFETFPSSCGFWIVGIGLCIICACRYRFTRLIRGSLSWRALNRTAVTSKWLLWYVYKWNDYSHSPTESCC